MNKVYTITILYTNYLDYSSDAYSKVAKTKEKAIQIMHEILKDEQDFWMNEKLANAEVYDAKLEIGSTSILYTDNAIEFYIVVNETEIE